MKVNSQKSCQFIWSMEAIFLKKKGKIPKKSTSHVLCHDPLIRLTYLCLRMQQVKSIFLLVFISRRDFCRVIPSFITLTFQELTIQTELGWYCAPVVIIIDIVCSYTYLDIWFTRCGEYSLAHTWYPWFSGIKLYPIENFLPIKFSIYPPFMIAVTQYLYHQFYFS